ncbi:conserved hypothetical protein [Cenarchaeum symbiosum A]|uniref:Uncharacterized protein n=1 Tax=Cenarchaeum symbiosum (strain A) TaxID=414004 RepID=A0RU77_CENSY|nr:conserved hypothetical protein [Cenarchaeum symbiosum A]
MVVVIHVVAGRGGNLNDGRRQPLPVKIIDLYDPARVAREPDDMIDVLSGSFEEGGHTVHKVQLRLYTEGDGGELGPYSLITSYVEADAGSVEMIYDEGYRGADALGRAAKFLAESMGVSGVVLRSMMALEGGASPADHS